MKQLTIQAFLNGIWQDIAALKFDEQYHIVGFYYLSEHYAKYFGERGNVAVSINYPVLPFNDDYLGIKAVLQDIIPAGASYRYWVDHLDLKNVPDNEQVFRLLEKATIAPVGNLRIKESVLPSSDHKRFSVTEVINRQYDFLEFASQNGAMVGGATGAGGEAPKLLVRRLADEVWIDNAQLGEESGDYYLVKYPRGKNREAINADILRTEYHYYHELAAMGFSTIDTHKMILEEGERYPSLWLPRFDIAQHLDGTIKERYALESVYSMLGKMSGGLNHIQTLSALIQRMEESALESPNVADFVIEWVKRDLLNIAFGNSDNHGRNTAFLRNQKTIWLAPIYDFAPMKADPDGIIRTMKWESNLDKGVWLEEAGEYRFVEIAEALQKWVEPELLLNELKALAQQLIGLKQRLAARGVPLNILDFPALGFDYLPEKLTRWGLM